MVVSALGEVVECSSDGGPPECFGDMNGDNTVDTSDLLFLLANWGPCP